LEYSGSCGAFAKREVRIEERLTGEERSTAHLGSEVPL
jgi:hypothetical protein